MNDRPETVTRYPLTWPIGWRRTPPVHRQRASFRQSSTRHDGTGGTVKSTGIVSPFAAVQRLEDQLDKLGAGEPTLSTNLQLRLDGRPRSDAEPADPGVAVYFRFKGRATVFACDRYTRVGDNIAAIAAHIDALRRIERYGVGSIEQALAGYRALPADTAADWRAVFGFRTDERVTAEAVQQRFRERATVAHPDRGGSDVEMAHINRARDFALEELLR